jgi:hypothetical protein
LLQLPPIPEIPEPVRGKSFVIVETYHVGDPAHAVTQCPRSEMCNASVERRQRTWSAGLTITPAGEAGQLKLPSRACGRASKQTSAPSRRRPAARTSSAAGPVEERLASVYGELRYCEPPS